MSNQVTLVTGTAGFIGYHLSNRLLAEGHRVVGIDNLNNYYDVNLKKARLAQLQKHPHFHFEKIDLVDRSSIEALFKKYEFPKVVHLAAQAGVRYSLENPHAYLEANLVGFVNVIDAARQTNCENFIYASSSSVYGANTQIPFSAKDHVDHPVSLYAATKKSNELIAHAYAVNHELPVTGLRFFTVYGPWGRPDMALFIFTKAILGGERIDVYNNGKMERDFTYVEDVVEGVVRLTEKPATPASGWSSDNPDPSTSFAPCRIYNVGHHQPVQLMDFIAEIERQLDKKATINFMPIQPGDVPNTYADVSGLMHDVGYQPQTSISAGIEAFIKWYKSYYEI